MEPIGRVRDAMVAGLGAGAPVGRMSGAGFALPAGRPNAAPAALPLGALLAVQEAAGGEPPGERAARRRGRALLAELAGLQHDMLGAGTTPDRLAALRALVAEALPPPADLALAAALAAIVLRARVELARFSEGT